MSAPVGRREFFALEAGEYLERLALLVGGLEPPAGEDLVRHARALRGAALMAGPPGFAAAAAALESTAKGLRDGALSWSPELAERLAQSIERSKALLRRVREWTETDSRQCERIAQELELEPRDRARGPGGSRTGERGDLTSGVRAYVAREAAAVAGTLDQVADTVERPGTPGTADQLLHRLQPLRGLGALPGLAPLPELLETLDLAVVTSCRRGAWSPLAGRAFRAVGGALSRMARDIAELGIPQHDSTEVVQAVESLRAGFLEDDDIVAIEALFPTGDRTAVLSRGTPPAPQFVPGDSAIELVSLGDRLRQAAEQLRAHLPRSARTLQLYSLVLALRGLSLTPAVRAGTRALLDRLDRDAMSGLALTRGDAYSSVLRDAADLLAGAADAGGSAALPELLAPLAARLDRMSGVESREAAVIPIAALAPEAAPDTRQPEPEPGPADRIVPIESLLYETAVSPQPPLSPRMLPFERTFTTYHRLLREAGDPALGPVVPIASLAPDTELVLVPIQSLLYRGRRALERAELIRRELDAALRVRRDFAGVETLLAELLDLVPLALDDDR
jgi:HPt (histidine-containing phosphotransfer) domain-containing protein